MRRLAKALAVLVVCMAALLPPAAAAPRGAPATRARPPQPGDVVPDEVLVAFRAGARPAEVAASVGGRVHRSLEGLGVHLLKVPSGSVARAVDTLARHPSVAFAEPNGYLFAFVDPSDPYDNTACLPASDGGCYLQWAWERVQAYQAWDVTTGSTAVKIAFVDTGLDVGDPLGNPPDTAHPDIACGRPITYTSFVSGETGNDDNGHGTHVAGIGAACTDNAVGVAGGNWNAHLLSAKVLAWYGGGTYAAVASGIRWAADQGAKVISLSLGGGPSKTVKNAITYAWNKGAVLACAAGNSGTAAKSYPAAYPLCIAVAATDANDQKASFSSYGAGWVDVAAPGVNIVSTMQDNWWWCYLCWGEGYLEEYDALSGTSMATPMVAGLAALIWASGQCATNTCVRDRIESTADPIAGTGTYWAKGRINYARALGAIP